MRQLFMFWEFGGDNKSWCNLKCPYCYGGKKEMRHYWNGDVDKWEKALVGLNRDLYIVMSYGESLGMKGFYECVEMIGKHPTWTLCIVTNFMLDPHRLLDSRLAKEKRLFLIPTWHPLGVEDKEQGWETFKEHLLMAKSVGVPVHVMYCWYRPQIGLFPKYFEWLDANDFRVSVRRFYGSNGGFRGKVLHMLNLEKIPSYTKVENDFIYANTCPKVREYRLKEVPASPKGKMCAAGKDLILVKYNGDVSLCADCCNNTIGNIFNSDFKLNTDLITCPTNVCGGDYGMLHFADDRFFPLPKKLEWDTFVSIVENIPQSSPVAYPDRVEMLNCLEKLKLEVK